MRTHRLWKFRLRGVGSGSWQRWSGDHDGVSPHFALGIVALALNLAAVLVADKMMRRRRRR
jgi:hypothetical protein